MAVVCYDHKTHHAWYLDWKVSLDFSLLAPKMTAKVPALAVKQKVGSNASREKAEGLKCLWGFHSVVERSCMWKLHFPSDEMPVAVVSVWFGLLAGGCVVFEQDIV